MISNPINSIYSFKDKSRSPASWRTQSGEES